MKLPNHTRYQVLQLQRECEQAAASPGKLSKDAFAKLSAALTGVLSDITPRREATDLNIALEVFDSEANAWFLGAAPREDVVRPAREVVTELGRIQQKAGFAPDRQIEKDKLHAVLDSVLKIEYGKGGIGGDGIDVEQVANWSDQSVEDTLRCLCVLQDDEILYQNPNVKGLLVKDDTKAAHRLKALGRAGDSKPTVQNFHVNAGNNSQLQVGNEVSGTQSMMTYSYVLEQLKAEIKSSGVPEAEKKSALQKIQDLLDSRVLATILKLGAKCLGVET